MRWLQNCIRPMEADLGSITLSSCSGQTTFCGISEKGKLNDSIHRRFWQRCYIFCPGLYGINACSYEVIQDVECTLTEMFRSFLWHPRKSYNLGEVIPYRLNSMCLSHGQNITRGKSSFCCTATAYIYYSIYI